MKIHLGTLSVIVLVTFALGILVGHTLFDDSSVVDRLSKEIDGLRSSTLPSGPHRAFPRPKFSTSNDSSTSLSTGSEPFELAGFAGAYPSTPAVDESRRLILTSDEDQAYATELVKRRQAGWYFLKDQAPAVKANRASMRQEGYEMTVDKEGPRYRALLAGLDVDATTREQIVDHIGKIAAADAEVSLAANQVLEARQDLERRLEQISPEAVSQLKESEAMRRAELEYEGHDDGQKGLGEYLAEHLSGPIEPEQQETIIRLIREADAVTAKYSTGVFDGIFVPVMGARNVAENAEVLAGEIDASVERLQEAMRQSELPPEYQQTIRDYYAYRAQNKRTVAEKLRLGLPLRPPGFVPPEPPDFPP